MLSNRPESASLVSICFLALGAIMIQPYGDIHHFGTVTPFLLGCSLMLVGFFFTFRIHSLPLLLFWIGTLLPRFILLSQVPGGDIYRYLWEGKILLHGFNPYLVAPDSSLTLFLHDELWKKVEHPTITAIYPPLAQLFFAGLSALSHSVIHFKLSFLLADVAIVLLLLTRVSPESATRYAWNPLVIYSFSGGGHYDSLFLLAMTAAWILFEKGRFPWASFSIGIAIALKWICLPLWGWMLFREWKNRGLLHFPWISFLAGFTPFAFSWAALCLSTNTWSIEIFPVHFTQLARSCDLIPSFVGLFLPETRYANSFFLIPTALLWLWVITQTPTLSQAGERLFAITLLFSPMIHAWYFTWMIPFLVVSKSRASLAISFSAFAYFWVYHSYQINGGKWELPFGVLLLLWVPYLVGLAYDHRKK